MAERGSIILGLFGIGAAIPLVAVAYASRSGFHRMRERVLAKVDAFKKVFAFVIGLTGIAILTGFDKRIEAMLTGILPDWWVRLAIGI